MLKMECVCVCVCVCVNNLLKSLMEAESNVITYVYKRTLHSIHMYITLNIHIETPFKWVLLYRVMPVGSETVVLHCPNHLLGFLSENASY
jgi:hypothetical protein